MVGHDGASRSRPRPTPSLRSTGRLAATSLLAIASGGSVGGTAGPAGGEVRGELGGGLGGLGGGYATATSAAAAASFGGSSSSYSSSSSVAAAAAAALGAAATEPNPPPWPSSVIIVDNTTDMKNLSEQVTDIWNANGWQPPEGAPFAQFSKERWAILFKPGSYNLDIPVGYYTEVAGLGLSPNEVSFTGARGVYVPCGYRPHGPGQLDTFWRSAANFHRQGDLTWAVSQAAPLRQVNISGDLNLVEHDCYASGGFLADAWVSGNVNGANQQQWFARNANVTEWRGVAWSAVLAGVEEFGAACELEPDENFCGGSRGSKQTVRKEEVPVVAEKPFISVQPGDESRFQLNVPPVRRNSRGLSWDSGLQIPFEQVHLALPGESATTMNAHLTSGHQLVISPGIYDLEVPLRVSLPNSVVLCLGLATLRPSNGMAAIEVAGGLPGVRIAGCLIEPIDQSTGTLVKWNQPGMVATSSDGTFENPGHLHDLFVRVGGPDNQTSAKIMVQIDDDNVVGDNLWLWRADHFDSLNSTPPIDDARTMNEDLRSDHGLVVNGANVTMYGLAVEHQLKDQVVWNGENGQVLFFQCEVPYDVSPAWAEKGYVAYRVSESVQNHSAIGFGIYSYFRDHEVWLPTAIAVPEALEESVEQPFVVFLSGHGGINTTINHHGPGVGFKKHFEVAYLNNLCSDRCRNNPHPFLFPLPVPGSSSRHRPWLSVLVVALVAFGVGASCVYFGCEKLKSLWSSNDPRRCQRGAYASSFSSDSPSDTD